MAKEAKAPQKRRCFVISPIGAEGSDIRKQADMVLEYIIRPSLPNDNWVVERSDEPSRPDLISENIIEAILDWELAIADMTGLNPNVFYEIGLRHMANKPIILIAQKGTVRPADTSNVRDIFYDLLDPGSHKAVSQRISEMAKAVMEEGYVVRNPVTAARGLAKLSESADQKDQIVADLVQQVQGLQSMYEALSGRTERFMDAVSNVGKTFVYKTPASLGDSPNTYTVSAEEALRILKNFPRKKE